MRASSCAIRSQIHHEATYSAGGLGRSAPVVVVRVVAAGPVALGPQLLDKSIRVPALEAARAVFDAFYRFIAWEGRLFRVADRAVEGFGRGGPDGGGGEEGVAGVAGERV